jgi:ribosomal protein S18 acetylase RimI-like enzyme
MTPARSIIDSRFSRSMTPIHIGDFVIRRAEPRDTDAAYAVCLHTGDSGRDAAHLYDDPMALGNIYVGPYLKFEPDLSFVLEDAQGVCGYALGALETKSFYKRYLEEWLPELRRKHPAPTSNPAPWNKTQQAYQLYHYPEIFWPEPYEEFPSHLHIDLMERAQRHGLGQEMMHVLLDEMIRKGSPGTHLAMAIDNARAERFYRKLGFHELARTADTLYLGKRLPDR